ncbi:hypothetical protein HA052_04530 [Chromobacterium haemolyticum]|uniref:DUF5710 domain-containing protein n=1 Tax=Chromobacterium fluminis TaxID=3044269 RepID=A0ABX0LAQ8_9NEIS|nr:DUF5710 domain-containing protein [Chromobacterium haemolyticum]NHR04457.1 hypothetical protein [Chromobacterium haemolyticum]
MRTHRRVYDQKAYRAAILRDLQKQLNLSTDPGVRENLKSQINQHLQQDREWELSFGRSYVTPLKVPYSERFEAQKLGAVRNRELKRWEVPPHKALRPFLRWM